jgi:mRNA interferase RelE/StbE
MPMEYRVEVKEHAVKELAKLQPDIGRKILDSIESLASNPRPRPSIKLRESASSYRLRVGDYRVLYQVDDSDKIVMIFKVGHRREVYHSR